MTFSGHHGGGYLIRSVTPCTTTVFLQALQLQSLHVFDILNIWFPPITILDAANPILYFRFLHVISYAISHLFFGLPSSRYDIGFNLYRVSQEECARLRESVPCVKLYRYNPKNLSPKLNGYGDNGQRKVWASLVSTYYTSSVTSYLSNAPARSKRHGHAVTLACALQHGSSDVTR